MRANPLVAAAAVVVVVVAAVVGHGEGLRQGGCVRRFLGCWVARGWGSGLGGRGGAGGRGGRRSAGDGELVGRLREGRLPRLAYIDAREDKEVRCWRANISTHPPTHRSIDPSIHRSINRHELARVHTHTHTPSGRSLWLLSPGHKKTHTTWRARLHTHTHAHTHTHTQVFMDAGDHWAALADQMVPPSNPVCVWVCVRVSARARARV